MHIKKFRKYQGILAHQGIFNISWNIENIKGCKMIAQLLPIIHARGGAALLGMLGQQLLLCLRGS